MRKIALTIIVLVTGMWVAKAQYKKDNWYLSPKISFADYSDRNEWDGYSISKIPPLSLALEYGVNDYFSAGAFMGFSNEKFSNDTISTNIVRNSSIAVGGVASIHFAGWIEKWSKYSIFLGDWDFYLSGGVMLQWYGNKKSDVWNETTEEYEDTSSSDVKLRIRPVLGVRYYVTDDFCMLLEVGKANLGLVTTGVTWRL